MNWGAALKRSNKTTTWYRTNTITNVIEPVTVVNETASFITIKEGTSVRRQMKRSSWEWYFPTWGEAWLALVEHYEARLKQARQEVTDLSTLLHQLQSMKEPGKK